MDYPFTRAIPHIRRATSGEVKFNMKEQSSEQFKPPLNQQQRLEQQSRQNKRTAWVLGSVVAVFFLGILLRKIFEPSILNLMQ